MRLSEIARTRNATRDSQNGIVHSRNFWNLQSYLLKGINYLLASKDHAQAETKRHCVKIMACSCLSFAVGHLKKKKKKEKMEKIAVWPITVYTSELVCECCWV